MKKMILLTFVFLAAACSKSPERLSPYRWVSVGPTVDSLTLELEKHFNDFADVVLLDSELTALRAASASVADSAAMAGRIAFWECRLAQRSGLPDSARSSVRRAMAMADSVNRPYDYYRIRGLQRQLDRASGAENYHQLDRELRYYQSIGDMPMTAVAYINLATNLYHIGEYELSLEFMKKGNDINSELGFHKMVSKNRINIANIEFSIGNHDEGRRILTELLHSDDIAGDSPTINLIKRNLYAHTGEVEWLFKAYAGVASDSTRRDLQGLYTAMLSKYYFENGVPDSAMAFSRMAYRRLPDLSDYDHRAMVLDAYAATLEHEGKTDSALQMRKQIEAYRDSAAARMQRNDILRIANMREVQTAIAAERENVQKMKLNFLVGGLLVLSLAAVVFFIFYRRYHRNQIAIRDSSLKVEKSQRHLLALTLAMDEKNNTFQSIVDEIERMSREGTIASSEAATVKNIIRMNLAGAEERDSFRRMFMTVNPKFVEELHRRYPDLSETYVKLATYIYIGLDNSQIARQLVIRPESVKQARWRLRKLLGLTPDESLDETLRSLA